MTSSNESIWSLDHKGEIYLQLGQYEQALEYFNEMSEELEKLNKPSAWVYAHRGEAHRLLKSWSDALNDFNQAIINSGGETNSKYAWAFAHRGETHRQKTPPDNVAARKDFTRAISITKEKYSWAYAHRGATYNMHPDNPNLDKDMEEALKDFTQAIDLYPKYAWAYAYRSIVHLVRKKDNGELAYRDLLDAIKHDKNIIGEEILNELKNFFLTI